MQSIARDTGRKSSADDKGIGRVCVGGNARESSEVQVGGSHAQEANNSHFSTDHLRKNLKGRAISSGFITVMAQGVQFALTLALHHDSGSIADAPGFRSGGHGVDNHRVFARLQRSRPFHSDGAAGRHHPRPGFQSFLDQRRAERLDQSARGGGCAGGRLVLPGATARRGHPRPLHHLLAGWFGGPAHGPFEPADAFQSDRTHPGWFGFGWSFGGRWHGLAEIWLLVVGRDEPDDKHGCAFDDLVGIPVASSIFYPAQRDAVLAPFRREPDRREFFVLPCPRAGRTFDRPVLRSVFGRPLFKGILFARTPFGTIHGPNRGSGCHPAFSRLQTQPDRLSQFLSWSFSKPLRWSAFFLPECASRWLIP